MVSVTEDISIRGFTALLGYVSMSEKANKLLQLVAEHPILYDWRRSSYSRKDKIDQVWENFGKGLNVMIYC
jgi:hypothetical protein